MKRAQEGGPAQAPDPGKRPKLDAAALKAKVAQSLSKLSKFKTSLASTATAAAAATSAPPPASRSDAAAPSSRAGTAGTAAASAPSTAAAAAAATKESVDDTPEVSLYDPTLQVPKLHSDRRRKPGLNLFQMGAVPKEHEQSIAAHSALPLPLPDLPKPPGQPVVAQILVTQKAMDPVPDMEWWDVAILAQPTYEALADGTVALKEGKITNLVEHPVPVEPPVSGPPPEPQALKLTKKEMKKIRKQRREEREKEKQLSIQTGLLEAPKDKVRLSNMPRVYGADGVADATAIEMKVREAQREREAAHEDRNLARKLTTDERKAKKLRKMFDDKSNETHVQVFRIRDLKNKHNRYKVQINAGENRLTGVCVCTETGMNVVVVEGDRKGIQRFNRLMLRRIDWNPTVNADGADDEMFEELNKCHLVWQGLVAKPAFGGFQTESCLSEQEGRNFLARNGVVQYWDAASCYVPVHDGIV